jgi:predicted  nucleic acid-binding Zn-ribbon protein
LTGSDAAAASRHMLTPVLQGLLILQDRDSKRHGLQAQLKSVPDEIAQVERKIASEKAAIEAARTELRDLEVRKKALENEIGSNETKLGQYRTQQLSIRKNDEYQAMGHQIELTQAAIADLEGKELELMYAIDGAKARFAAAESELKANIAGHESRIATLREREASVRAELTSVQAEVDAARAPVEPFRLRVYDRIAARNFPVIVAIHAGKCGGCHLKVSSEVESAVRGKSADPAAQLPTCDQCGRIVYWET